MAKWTRFALLMVALQALPLLAQSRTLIQFQNAGANVMLGTGYFKMNFTGGGCTPSNVGGVLTVNCAGGGSGTVSNCTAAGNAYYSASGTTIVCDTSITDNGAGGLTLGSISPTTYNGGAFSGTFTGAPTFSGNIAFTGTPTFSNTLALNTSGTAGGLSGTPNISIGTLATSSATQVANLNASTLGGATFAAPGSIGNTTASSGKFSALTAVSSINFNGTLLCGAVPTITSGGGTGIAITGNNSCGFSINVGTGTITNPIVLAMPTAGHGWHVSCDDVTSARSTTLFLTAQTASSTTAVTLTQLTNAAATTTPWTASDVLQCTGTAN